MSKIATASRFFGGGWYDSYTRYPFFLDRAAYAGNRFGQIKNSKILVAGCGFGYLIDEMMNQGFGDVWGCDVSAWAINEGKSLLPNIASRLIVGDCSNVASMNAVKTAAGLRGRSTFSLIITEDLLTVCDSTAEVQTMLTTLRANTTNLFHILSCADTMMDWQLTPEMLWLTHADWRGLIGAESEWSQDTATGEIRP